LRQPSERELVRAVLAGDRTAYGTLYDRYAPLIRAVCYDRTHDLSEAQDLAQDVFLRAYQRLTDLRNPDSFGSWVVGIAKRRCLEWQRRVRSDRRRQKEQSGAEPIASSGDHDGCFTQLDGAIAELPEKEHLALHAFYLREESADEARRTLGLSRAGFYRVLGRARTRLKRRLSDDQENVR
jgi:RNA polymerase sigma-70 factor, ECF subfamily